MSCRSTNAGSAFIAFSRWDNGRLLSDSACLSIFHELRRSYRALPEDIKPSFTRDDYEDLLRDLRLRIDARPNLSDKKRASLIARLERASEDPTPDAEMLYALSEIRHRIGHRSEMLHNFLVEMARRGRAPLDEVVERFRSLEESAPRERTHRSPAGFADHDQQILDTYGLGREQGTAFAALQIARETRDVEMTLFRRAIQRIAIERYDEPLATPVNGLTLTGAGYDPRNGRLEIVIADANGERTLAYRRVPEDIWSVISPEARNPTAAECWWTRVRGESRFAYASSYESVQDGAAPRCSLCGQFATANHGCPIEIQPRDLHVWTTRSRWSVQRIPTVQLLPAPGEEDLERAVPTEVAVSISLPATRELRSAIAEGPVRIRDISYRHSQVYPQRTGYGVRTLSTSGDVVVWRDAEGELQINLAELRCPCPTYRETYRCQHIDDVGHALRTRADLPNPSALDSEARLEMMRRAQQMAQEAAEDDWSRNPETYLEAARTWRADSEVLYSDDPAAFIADVEAARKKAREANRPVIPFYTENVLDGAAIRGSGKAFGVEIEFDFPKDWTAEQRTAANARIAQRLFDTGLTWSNRQEMAGASKVRGFRDTQKEATGEGNWTLEFDGTVSGGELISPGLYDEPETWSNLSTALDILREEGAIASRKSGSHVHVGTGDYNGDPAVYSELARLMTQHEDVVYRLSSDPGRGTHRKGKYAKPVPDVPPEGFTDVAAISRWQGTERYFATNFHGVRGSSRDHPEFRVFDASLDAGTIQAQIKMSVALTEAAKRNAASGGTQRGREPLGSHQQRRSGRMTRKAMTEEEVAADTATTRSFLDTLFRRREDKAHLAAIYANTRWSK